MMAKLLRHSSGTARAVERPEGRSGGMPDVARARVIATLQPLREHGVSQDSTDAEKGLASTRLTGGSFSVEGSISASNIQPGRTSRC
jgi:hypothetical protein